MISKNIIQVEASACNASVASVLLAVFCFILLSSCTPQREAKTGIRIPYPEPLPDSVPLAFLPGIVSSDSFDFNAAFSPDGQSFFFTRRIGDDSKIYITSYTNERWTEPVPVPFGVPGFSEADPVFGPDGNLYFISNRAADTSDTLRDYDIWSVSPQAGGRWAEPGNMRAINSDSAEYYISFSDNGNLYFASSRAGGFGQEDIYASRLINGQYTQPENLGTAINTARSEYDPYISAREDFLIFTSTNREDTFGAGDLYGAKRGPDEAWMPARNLGEKFNTTTRDFCAYLSPDGKYFFFSSEGDVKWILVESLMEQLHKL